tara:strand:- start:43 stop:1572 length:1530 start_codon:yes stop_codon:yes gene_type:complete
MSNLILILGDQLNKQISSLNNFSREKDFILMCEVAEEANYVKHHKKKIAFIFSAMRHFAHELKKNKFSINYIKLNDRNNTGTLKGEVKRFLKKKKVDKIILTFPGEFRIYKNVLSWQKCFEVPVEIREDYRFFCTIENFRNWAKNRKKFRMEDFYQKMRREENILILNQKPLGGKWNFDSENRNFPNDQTKIPKLKFIEKDKITEEVIEMVLEYFPNNFGDIEPFYYAVTREDALQLLENFFEERIINFGKFQDAMIEGEPWMFHSVLSFYLNSGLILPKECVKKAQESYFYGNIPLNSVEGFIRQILGWREYIRGIYWLKMPYYKELNFFQSKRSLPSFFWTAKTKMNCLKQSISDTKSNAYAHHIQRLMVIGNFALITGLNPDQVNLWYLTVYADAFEWVELPNVSGMVLYADGGLVASKPYAAGGNYINKMSNYCKKCKYKVLEKTEKDSCPFNYLYWDFIRRNKDLIQNNYRMSMIYEIYNKMDKILKGKINKRAEQFFENIESF